MRTSTTDRPFSHALNISQRKEQQLTTVTRERTALSPQEELVRRLRRAAVEPSRVFAYSDRTDERQPVEHVHVDGVDWFAPAQWPYAFIGGTCKVLQRAVDKLSVLSRPEYADALRILVTEPGEPASLPDPAEHSYPPSRWHKSGLTVPTIPVGDGKFLPATAVFYAQRRFADEGVWVQLGSRRLFRYEVPDLGPVALVALVVPLQREEV